MPPLSRARLCGIIRSLPLRIAFALAIVLMCIINMSQISLLYSRGTNGMFPITRLKSPALVYLPSAGAAGGALCACYSPPSSALNDIALFSSGTIIFALLIISELHLNRAIYILTACGFDLPSDPSPLNVIVCRAPPLANGDIMCEPSPSLIDTQAAQAACRVHVTSSTADGGAAASSNDVAFLSSRVAKFGTSLSCRRLGLGCTSGQTFEFRHILTLPQPHTPQCCSFNALGRVSRLPNVRLGCRPSHGCFCRAAPIVLSARRLLHRRLEFRGAVGYWMQSRRHLACCSRKWF